MKISFLFLAVAAFTGKASTDAQSLEESTRNPEMFGGREDGLLSQTQDQKTVICPAATHDLYEGHIHYGPRTRLILKNSATDPVVVSFVERNGTEASAANADISPAHLDPDAFIDPGVTKVFAVHEGHVFHVRDSKTGELLMQHRAGIVPIENRYQRQIPSCPLTTSDEEHEYPSSYRVMKKFPEWNPKPRIDRFKKEIHLDLGFRNTIRSQDGTVCPVNVYFVHKKEFDNQRPPQFYEKLTLHLGNNPLSTAKQELLDSSTKYERTYLGHQFVARLAHDESVVVDQIAITPIQVQDCGLKKATMAVKSMAHSEAIVIPVGMPITQKLTATENNTEWDSLVDQLNTTQGRRGLYFKMYTE
jgi:hypothetical protein